MNANVVRLNQPYPAQDAARTYFFNGRLLSAEDLRREQSLRETGQRQLARLIGCGIDRGLEVTGNPGDAQIHISAGLGIAPSGWVCEIDGFDLNLSAASTAHSVRGFSNCAAAFGDLHAPNAGTYLLVLTPAWIAEGRARTLLGDVGTCNRNIEQPAVRARLVPLNLTNAPGEAALRNWLARKLLTSRPGNPDDLEGWWPKSLAPTLTTDDLPLAVLQLDLQAKLVFGDMHAARRRLAPPPGGAGDALWPVSRALEMEAFGQQFLGQLIEKHPATHQYLPLNKDAFDVLPPIVAINTQADLTRVRDVFDGILPPSLRRLRSDGYSWVLRLGLDGAPVANDGKLRALLFGLNDSKDPDHFLVRFLPPRDAVKWEPLEG